jgi:hypothetical protein
VGQTQLLARLHAQRDFLCMVMMATENVFQLPNLLPLLEEALGTFLATYPKFTSSSNANRFRADEYPHCGDA